MRIVHPSLEEIRSNWRIEGAVRQSSITWSLFCYCVLSIYQFFCCLFHFLLALKVFLDTSHPIKYSPQRMESGILKTFILKLFLLPNMMIWDMWHLKLDCLICEWPRVPGADQWSEPSLDPCCSQGGILCYQVGALLFLDHPLIWSG